jgi:hypothetical protein
MWPCRSNGRQGTHVNVSQTYRIEGYRPSVVNVSRCHVTRASSSRSDLKGSLTDLPFLKGRWTLSRPSGARNTSRSSTPRRNDTTPGESSPLARKVGVCLPPSHYDCHPALRRLHRSVRRQGYAMTCPKPAGHRGIASLDGKHQSMPHNQALTQSKAVPISRGPLPLVFSASCRY